MGSVMYVCVVVWFLCVDDWTSWYGDHGLAIERLRDQIPREPDYTL